MKGRWVVVGISAAALVPVLALLLLVLWMGFWQNGPGEPIVYTLNHYRKIFTDPFTYRTFLNTVGFATTAVLVSLFFAVPTAWLVERTDLPGKNFIFVLVTLGALLPTFFTAMGWVFLLHPRIGIVNTFLRRSFRTAAGAVQYRIDYRHGLGRRAGFVLHRFHHGRRHLPHDGSGAGRSGAGARIGNLSHPSLRHAAAHVSRHHRGVDLYFTIALSAFEVPAIIGMSNKIFTFSTFIFYKIQPLEELPSYGMAGAVSTVLIVLALLLSWGYFRVLRFSHRYAVVTGKAYRPRLIELGPKGWLLAWSFLGCLFYRRQIVAFSPVDLGALLRYFQPPSWAALSKCRSIIFTACRGI